jgi:hypothetical protein
VPSCQRTLLSIWDRQNSTWTLRNQRRYLADTTVQLSPGEPYPTEGPPVESPDSKPGGSHIDEQERTQPRLGADQVAGIAVGVAAALIGLAVIVVVCLYGRKILRLHSASPHAPTKPKLLSSPSSVTRRPPIGGDCGASIEMQAPSTYTEAQASMWMSEVYTVYAELPVSPGVSSLAISQHQPPAYSRGIRRFSWEEGTEAAYRPSKGQNSTTS